MTVTATQGNAYTRAVFASGEIAYLINTYGARKVFGKVDGKTSLSENPIRLVRLGSQ